MVTHQITKDAHLEAADYRQLNSQLPKNKFQISKFVSAVLLFALLSLFAYLFHTGNGASAFPNHTWTGWAMQDFLASGERPDVVFLGSSLMLVPLAGVDANYLKRRLDGSKHHHSIYFEKQIEEKTGAKVNTFNFALPGEMPSDAYLIANYLLNDAKKPSVIVWGLGPRDFMDNLLPFPASTDTFANISHLENKNDAVFNQMLSVMMPNWMDRLNFKLEQYIYPYGQKSSLSLETNQFLDNYLNNFVPLPANTKAYPVSLRRQILPDYKCGELQTGEAFFRPADKESFADNLNEYRKRYAKVNWHTFTGQMQFFAKLLDLAKERHIHIVLLAMPISDFNRSLIQNYAWDAYKNSINVLATIKGATYIDMQKKTTLLCLISWIQYILMLHVAAKRC